MSEWRRGWPVVAAGAIAIGNSPGLFQNLSSLFTTGMSEEFGWSRGDIGTAAALGLLGSLAVPVLGRIADRISARWTVAASLLLLGAVYLGMAAQTGGLWQYRVLILGLALTIPGTSAVVFGRLIAARFERHRGLAIGLAVSGLSVSTVVLPPLIAATIAMWGWRAGFVALAMLAVLVGLPLCLLALRGQAVGPVRPASDDPAAAVPVVGLTAGEARRSGRFWRLATCGFLVNLATIGLVTQLVPFGLDRGLSAGEAALLLTAYGAAQVVGRLGIGALVDRFRPRRAAALLALVSAAGFAGLQLGAPGLPAMMTLVFLAGLMSGADNDLLPFFTARLFGVRAFGEAYGTILAVAVLGTAGGIASFALLHDATGGYGVALAGASAALALAALLFVTLGDDALPLAQGAAHAPDRQPAG